MKKIKNICIICTLIFIMIFSYSTSFCVPTPSLTPEQQAYIASYVRNYVAEAARYGWVEYDTGHRKEESLRNKAVNGKIRYDCASFCVAMLCQTLGEEVLQQMLVQDKNVNLRVTGFFDPSRNSLFKELTNEDVLLPGDVITYENYKIHALIYIGCDPKTGVHQLADVYSAETGKLINLTQFTNNTPIRYREFILGTKWGQVSRLNPFSVSENWQPESYIKWPNGSIAEIDENLIITDWSSKKTVWYNGMPNLIYGMDGDTGHQSKKWVDIVVESVEEVGEYLIGAITYTVKAPMVGVAHIAETLLNWTLQIFSGTDTLQMITIEDIIFNKVPLLNINIFEPLLEDSEISTTGINIIQFLRNNIIIWYYILRYIVIIAMLLALIYLGVRMAITTIAEDKAKYKKLLVDWLISFIIIFVIHYYIVIVVQGNEFMLNIFRNSIVNEGTDATDSVLSTQNSLFNEMREASYSFKLTEGFLGTIGYIVLIWYTIKFCIKYIKRMFNIYILIIVSPLIAISYAFDKIKDGKSQSLSRWMKELGFGVFIQSLHALIYTIFVSIILIQINNVNLFNFAFTCVLMFISFNFMDKAENLFESIFNMKTDSIATATATLESVATVKSTIGVVKGYGEIGKFALNKVGGAIKKTKIGNEIKDNLNELKYGDNKENKGKKSSVDGKIEKEKDKAKKQQDKLKAQRKEIRKEAMKTVGSLFATIPQLADNPGHGISLLIAGITGIISTRRKIISYKRKTKSTYKADAYAKVKALNARRDAEIELKQQMAMLMEDKTTIIGKGFAKEATLEEREQAETALKILEDKIQERLKQVDQSDIRESINNAIIKNDGKVTQKTLDDIAEELLNKEDEKNRKNEEQVESLEETEEIKTKEETKKEEFQQNVDETLADMMTKQAFTKSKSKQAFTGSTALMIKQAKERLQKKLEIEAINSKMSKNEKRENLERGLRQELEAYIKKQQGKESVLKDIKKEELSEMITLAMNSENSILRQLDNDKGVKSASNEQTNVGSQAGDGKSKTHSNVDINPKSNRKEKNQTENASGNTSENISGNASLKDIDFEKKLEEEIKPVLDSASQLRKSNVEVQRITRQDSRIKINDIIGELKRKKGEIKRT